MAEQAAVAVKADGVAGERSRSVVAATEEEQMLPHSAPTLTLTEANTETLAVTADRGGGRSDGRRVAVAVVVQQDDDDEQPPTSTQTTDRGGGGGGGDAGGEGRRQRSS